jgi:large subunit ribosomal protein L20
MMDGLRRANVTVDRKILADLAVRDAAAFTRFAEVARTGAGEATASVA